MNAAVSKIIAQIREGTSKHFLAPNTLKLAKFSYTLLRCSAQWHLVRQTFRIGPARSCGVMVLKYRCVGQSSLHMSINVEIPRQIHTPAEPLPPDEAPRRCRSPRFLKFSKMCPIRI